MNGFNNYDWIFKREFYSKSLTKEQKEHYFLKKNNAKLELYILGSLSISHPISLY